MLLNFVLYPLTLTALFKEWGYLRNDIMVVLQSRDLQLYCNTLYLSSPRICFFIVYVFIVMIHWVLIAPVPGLCLMFTFTFENLLINFTCCSENKK